MTRTERARVFCKLVLYHASVEYWTVAVASHSAVLKIINYCSEKRSYCFTIIYFIEMALEHLAKGPQDARCG